MLTEVPSMRAASARCHLHTCCPVRIVTAGCRGSGKIPGTHDHAIGACRRPIDDIDAISFEQAADDRPWRLLVQGGPRPFTDRVASSQQGLLALPFGPQRGTFLALKRIVRLGKSRETDQVPVGRVLREQAASQIIFMPACHDEHDPTAWLEPSG
jgi:hypothetical protein